MGDVDLRRLAGMLDDPNENVAAGVMAELLRHGDELLPVLSELQEADDPLLRKRVHELETIAALRRRRRDYLHKLEAADFDLVQALIELHLLWFDRDNPEMLLEMMQTFMGVAANNDIKDIAELGGFMARNNFAVPPEDEELDVENYCIGPILDDRLGSGVMLCTLALIAGIGSGLELGMVRIAGHFAVVNRQGEMVSPDNGWIVDRVSRLEQGDFWNDPRSVLRYASLMLFLSAVSADNFRYVHIIAHALMGDDDNDVCDFLPYPYNGREPDLNKQTQK